jgi:hypothetical protein
MSSATMPTTDELREAQARVGEALSRAKVSGDRQLLGQLRELGEQGVRLLMGLIRLRKLHAENNSAFVAPSRELVSVLDRLAELLGPVEFAMAEGQVYVNDVRIRVSGDHDAPAELGRLCARHELAGLRFRGPLTREQVLALASALASEPAKESPRRALHGKLRQAGITSVRLAAPLGARYVGATVNSSDAELGEAYARSAEVLANVWKQAQTESRLSPLRMRRMLADLTGLEAAQALDQLVHQAQDDDSPAFAKHSLAVASLAVAMGKGIGLAPGQVSDLGLAGFFHDVGYLDLGATDQNHEEQGALRLLAEGGLNLAGLQRVTTALEHHRDFDATPKPSLFSRIVRIADDYDTLTRIRGKSRLLAPPDALARMRSLAGMAYDPVLLQVLINQLGALPPGTLLELDDGTLAVVTSGARSIDTFALPLCAPLESNDDRFPEPIDLATSKRSFRVRG